ncbi:MAG: methyltransferase domain-containing protein [Gemmatimonadaceae bacterium]|nr:methyltransferase domain-containing protein [Gemmatimonadaceae bacterium]
MGQIKGFPYARFAQNRTVEEAGQMFRQRIEDALEIHARHHDSFSTRPCPYCGSAKSVELEKFHGAYGISRCDLCASPFVNPAPGLNALEDYYNNCECNKMMDRIYRARAQAPADFINDHRVRTTIEYLKQAKDPMNLRVLEIGCGSGSFLQKLRSAVDAEASSSIRISEYTGIDIDANAIALGQGKGVNLVSSSVEAFAKEQRDAYDIVLHFELIEHLFDPTQFMVDARALLKPDGVMIFTTPNANGLEMIASHYNSFRLLAHSIFPPMHLNAFSTVNISHFALRNGFAVVDIQTPGALDVDMVTVSKDHVEDEGLKAVAEFDDHEKGVLQHVLIACKASSHMRCVLRKA